METSAAEREPLRHGGAGWIHFRPARPKPARNPPYRGQAGGVSNALPYTHRR